VNDLATQWAEHEAQLLATSGGGRVVRRAIDPRGRVKVTLAWSKVDLEAWPFVWHPAWSVRDAILDCGMMANVLGSPRLPSYGEPSGHMPYAVELFIASMVKAEVA
jgi:hypothetical protein